MAGGETHLPLPPLGRKRLRSGALKRYIGMILDIHTHKEAPRPEALVCVAPESFSPVEGQLYSVGIHPWEEADPAPRLDALAELASRQEVAAIGEAGLDLAKGAPMYRQLLAFRRQVEISEEVGKPLIVHCVKTIDMIAGLRRDLRPSQPWVVHGFRGKPASAQQLLRCGCWLSFGERFNAETVRMVPADFLLAETDCSEKTIQQIIAALSEARQEDVAALAGANAARLLQIG